MNLPISNLFSECESTEKPCFAEMDFPTRKTIHTVIVLSCGWFKADRLCFAADTDDVLMLDMIVLCDLLLAWSILDRPLKFWILASWAFNRSACVSCTSDRRFIEAAFTVLNYEHNVRRMKKKAHTRTACATKLTVTQTLKCHPTSNAGWQILKDTISICW